MSQGNSALSGEANMSYSVRNALNAMELTTNFSTFVKANRELWSTFGKMDSHLYRKKLMKLMDAAKLSKEQRLAVHLMFALVKNKTRVIDGMNGMSETTKAMSWYEPVKTFIAGTITDYNTAAKAADKFPGTHIPTTNPGLDMLMWRLSTDKEARTLEAFFSRTTSVQLKNGPEAQEMAKSGYRLYWDTVVKRSKNTAPTEEAKYREEYYETSAGDAYYLIDDRLRDVKPASDLVGYTLEEITTWMMETA
jgi:hypothetical protein